MHTYQITIKDLSAITAHSTFTTQINADTIEQAMQYAKDTYAHQLDTDTDHIEILTITKIK